MEINILETRRKGASQGCPGRVNHKENGIIRWFHDMENHGKYRMIVNDSEFFCEQFDMSQSMISQLGTSKCTGRIVKPTLPT